MLYQGYRLSIVLAEKQIESDSTLRLQICFGITPLFTLFHGRYYRVFLTAIASLFLSFAVARIDVIPDELFPEKIG